jgi:hypothetical protein
VGKFIEENIPTSKVWIPSKDTGIDMLVTDSENLKTVSIQVKYSKDFSEGSVNDFDRKLKACGWWRLNRDKVEESEANYWVFVLYNVLGKVPDFLIIEPMCLLEKTMKYQKDSKVITVYFWVTKDGKRCWDGRGLKEKERNEIINSKSENDSRNFTQFLNNWQPIKDSLGIP